MSPRKIDEVASDIDDASDTLDELQAEPGHTVDTTEKLDELQEALQHASETLDDIDNGDPVDETNR